MYYPVTRLRRLRNSRQIRKMVQETELSVRSLIYPLFVTEGRNVKEQVKSMPGIFRFSLDNLLKEIKEAAGLNIPAILLFGIPERKDERATGAYAKSGIVQTAINAIKEKFPSLVIITDVCLCAYNTTGHCGVAKQSLAGSKKESGVSEDEHGEYGVNLEDSVVYNDASLELLARTALSHAEAGADMVAPSSMMDGQVSAVRKALDANNYKHTPIMSYSAKFASNFYGPFREIMRSAPGFGDRKTYQLNPANSVEAMREIEFDVQEGADIVMVKPALSYLDIISKAKERFGLPIAAYNVSGECAMLKAASSAGCFEEKAIVLEVLTSLRRAGADLIITYYAKDAARWLSGQFLL